MAWDTFISYSVVEKDGRIRNKKGGTIERLYERFHGETCDFYVSSINEEDCIFKNRVVDVVKTGIKECYKVVTLGGHEIVCTGDHGFYVGNGSYIKAATLEVGDTVFIHNNSRNRKDWPQARYTEIIVKYHPNGIKKIVTANDRQGVKKYSYLRYRVKKANLVIEADHNNLTYDDYISLLDSENRDEIDKLWFIPDTYVVHHKDLDSRNDKITNLVVMDNSEHRSLHAKLNHNALRFKAVPDVIESINPVGEIETYDIKCLAPYNNFIANKFVVHNSGKTSLAKSVVARLHNASDDQALWIDTENAFDSKYALKMGVDPERLVIFYPETGERALEIAEGGIRSGEFAVVVLDSVAALSPRAEMEGDIGDAHVGLQARLMSQFVRKTAFAIRESEVAMVTTNQLRDRIARIPLPPETPAGRALKHHTSVRIWLKNAGPIKQDNEIVGSKIEFTVKKNKVAAPYGTGAFEIWHDRGVCLEADLLDTGVEVGVIDQKGAWFSYRELRLGQGRVNAIRALSDKDTYQRILEEVINAKKVEG